ncbi:pheromone-binding protein Gp-9 [Nasonia vitripennis]|uniref:Putative odorant binding protein 78 n=1 Tax=Nasonia vitripennis TaxID=7425 RepID=G8B1T3_NASVI|nr:pheromone-binding protein Gp-9 [Nasonia vitripennis]CCD17847.1 putative odorant binding protein 78 [Nasonia vitripennis]
MKTIVFTLCMMTVAVTCSPRPGGRGGGSMFSRESVKKCMAEMDIKREDIKTLKQNNDPKLSCLNACAMTKEEIMDEAGNIDADKLIKATLEIVQKKKPDINVEELETAMLSCIEKAKEVEDKCMKAKTLVVCSHEYWKANVKGNPSSAGGEEE